MFQRLWRLVSITLEQQRTVEELYLADGTCTCGAIITRQSPKMVMSQINSSWATLAAVRNTMAIGIYCGRCAELIDVCLKSLKQLPERDKLVSKVISGNA